MEEEEDLASVDEGGLDAGISDQRIVGAEERQFWDRFGQKEKNEGTAPSRDVLGRQFESRGASFQREVPRAVAFRGHSEAGPLLHVIFCVGMEDIQKELANLIWDRQGDQVLESVDFKSRPSFR